MAKEPKSDASPVALSDDQFDKIVDLLTPGYELSSMLLEQHKRAQAEAQAYADAQQAAADELAAVHAAKQQD